MSITDSLAANYDRIVHEAGTSGEEVAADILADVQVGGLSSNDRQRLVAEAGEKAHEAILDGVPASLRSEARSVADQEARTARETVRRYIHKNGGA